MLRSLVFAVALAVGILPISASAQTVAFHEQGELCDSMDYGSGTSANTATYGNDLAFHGKVTAEGESTLVCKVRLTTEGKASVAVREHFKLGNSAAIVEHGFNQMTLYLVQGQDEDGSDKLVRRVRCTRLSRTQTCTGAPTDASDFELTATFKDGKPTDIAFQTRINRLGDASNVFGKAASDRNMALVWQDGKIDLTRQLGNAYGSPSRPVLRASVQDSDAILNKVVQAETPFRLEVHFVQMTGTESKVQALPVNSTQIKTVWTVMSTFMQKLS